MVKIKKCLLIFISIALFLFLLNGRVMADDYRFRLERKTASVIINDDASATIEYILTFYCDPSGKAIDIVDIGMPNPYYRLGTASASIDGYKVKEIKRSEYVKPGVEVHLGSNSIKPGSRGRLKFRIIVDRMVYPDTRDKNYASTRFSPTWYGAQWVYGTTSQEVYFYFPPGVKPEETRYHDEKFTLSGVSENRLFYLWKNEVSPSTQYTYGVSFPRKYVKTVYSPPLKLGKEHIIFVIIFIPGLLILMGLYFHGTGRKRELRFLLDMSVYLILFIIGIPLVLYLFFVAPPFGVFGFVIVFSIFSGIQNKKRKMKYLPPSVRMEGLGVRMNLTAPEAAVLLEVPLNKVITMVLFGLLKKGCLQVKSTDPLRLAIADPMPVKREELHSYERTFLKAVKPNGSLTKSILEDVVVDIVNNLKKKMETFSYHDTVKYYRNIVAEAWKKVEEAKTPELKSEEYAENFEWTIFDENYDRRTREVFVNDYVFLPRWWYSTGWSRSTPSMSSAPSEGGVSLPNLPTLPGADFANRVVTWTEGISNNIVGSIESFTGAVTRTTNPPPVSSGGGWSGGGRSCACACACAGCACACAGGGR